MYINVRTTDMSFDMEFNPPPFSVEIQTDKK